MDQEEKIKQIKKERKTNALIWNLENNSIYFNHKCPGKQIQFINSTTLQFYNPLNNKLINYSSNENYSQVDNRAKLMERRNELTGIAKGQPQ